MLDVKEVCNSLTLCGCLRNLVVRHCKKKKSNQSIKYFLKLKVQGSSLVDV